MHACIGIDYATLTLSVFVYLQNRLIYRETDVLLSSEDQTGKFNPINYNGCPLRSEDFSPSAISYQDQFSPLSERESVV